MAYNKDTDYSALIQKAADQGDYATAAGYESQRNEKIDTEGLSQYGKTDKYQSYLPDNYSSAYTDQLGAAANNVANIGTFKPSDYGVPDYSNSVTGGQLTNAANDVANIDTNFQYDYANDKNAQAYSNQYLRNAQRATRDTMAAGAAQTGGLASSYATSAAAQAGQNYLTQLNDSYTDLANLALANWQANNSAKTDKLSALQSASNSYDSAYSTRYNNALNAYSTNANAAANTLSALTAADSNAYAQFSGDRNFWQGRTDNAQTQENYEKEQQTAADRYTSETQFSNAMSKWQASGVLDAASAAVLGLPAGTLYSDYAQWQATLAQQKELAYAGL